MRFLGNKESMIPEIKRLLSSKGLLDTSLILYDAFCGSGAVSDALKGVFNIISGDMLNWCVVYTSGRLNAHQCDFSKLNVPPFEHLNKTAKITEGFFFKIAPPYTQNQYGTQYHIFELDSMPPRFATGSRLGIRFG